MPTLPTFVRSLIPACLLLCLAACGSLPARPAPSAGAETISGRMSVRYKDLASGHEEAVSGNFDWTQDGKVIDLALLDPLGQTVALVHSAPERSTLAMRDGRRFSGPDPEALTSQALGWSLPVRGMADWIQGRAHGDDPAAVTGIDADGVRRIRQDGWTISFPGQGGSMDSGAEAAASPPRRIDLSYPGPGVSVDLKLVVDKRSTQ